MQWLMQQRRIKAIVGTILISLFQLTLVDLAQAADKVVYFHNDALGSPVAATDQSGRVLWREEYRPYGKRLLNQNESAGNKLWFTGKYEEAELGGLQYFGARWYHPDAGRFMSMDPVGVRESVAGNPMMFNRYAYANNNPYKYIDPDGRAAETVWDVFNIGLGAASFVNNVSQGNYGSAALDAAGVAVDGLAAAVPLIPGGAGSLIKAGREGAETVTKSVTPNAQQAANLKRFQKKIPSNSKDSVELRELPNGGVATQATSPGKVPGSKAVYEKQIDVNGKTIQATKTTYDPKGNIVHVKDKLNGGTYQ